LDLVIATGQSNTVKDFVELAFGEVGLEWQKYVELDSRYLRPTEVDALIGDASIAQSALGWSYKVRLDGLAKLMVEHDLLSLSKDDSGPVDVVSWRY
jgi:GDPmannose 4,6-dehydratase